MVALAGPIVGLVYERGAFDVQAARLVGGLLMAYGVGMPAYLGRDVLVRVFYALGDGTTPFRFSMAGIGLNVVFDWLLVGGPTPWGLQLPALNFGAPGLVLATVAVNEFIFKQAVKVGDILSFFSRIVRVGRTSVTVKVEVFAERFQLQGQYIKVTEANLTYVAVDDQGKPRPVPAE